MTKLSRFFQNVIKSCTSWQFYQTLLKTRFLFSLKYFLLLIFLVSLVFSTQVSIVLVGGTNYLIKKGAADVKKFFPDQLEFSLKNGQVLTNLPQPFFLPFSAFPSQSISSRDLGQNKKNLLVIDTKTPFSLEKFQSYSTVLWITGASVAYQEPHKDTTSILPLKETPDFTINKQTVISYLNNVILPSLRKFLPFLVAGIYLLSFVGNLWSSFLSVAFLALVVFLLTKISKHNLSYAKSLQLTIHANTLPLLISTLASLFFLRFPMPFWHSLLTLIILFYFLNKTTVSFPRLPCKGKRESI